MLKLYVSLQNMLERLSREEGQTAVEYGLVIALISLVVIAAVAALFGPGGAVLTSITDAITTAFGG
jgi:Flp pilus assembly pilin Flp